MHSCGEANIDSVEASAEVSSWTSCSMQKSFVSTDSYISVSTQRYNMSQHKHTNSFSNLLDIQATDY